jgi:hypothetical protein
MKAVTARRPRRRRTAPAASLPRPAAGDAPPIQSVVAGRTTQPREHHVTRDYRYVRGDLLWVSVTTAITLGMVLVVWALSPSW